MCCNYSPVVQIIQHSWRLALVLNIWLLEENKQVIMAANGLIGIIPSSILRIKVIVYPLVLAIS